jgi:uncharacterized membrane protein
MTTTTLANPIARNLSTDKARIQTIDIMRGVVMVIMALDHTRDFFHLGAVAYNPTDMDTTTPQLFFTRWITHYCAPTFVFLSGTSIFLQAQRKNTKDLSIFLLSRGLWLILLEVVVIRFGLLFNFHYDVIILQVIWGIGAAMVLMSLLIHLNYYVLLTIGLLIVFGHNLFDLTRITPESPLFASWSIFRQAGFVAIPNGPSILVPYPMLPWAGIMIIGYCIGKMYESKFDSATRRKLLLQLGIGSIVLFILLRFINWYGDPAPWSVQKNALYTFMSFINTTKYPISLMYALMTLGPVLVILSFLESTNTKSLRPFIVFGRVPLFYYIIHFYIIHIVGLLLFMNKTGTSLSSIDFHFDKTFGGLTAEAGYSLFWVYVAWATLIVILYPVCRWYNNYKSTHRDWWLSYL